jgi:archaellum component FlaF (FlaF/FlaG flagellin family)
MIGCSKMPDAEFSLNQYEYSAGDAINYNNLSIDHKSSTWEILNSDNEVTQTFEGNHPNIVTSILSPDGAYTLKLSAYSKKQKKVNVTEKTFLVKSTKYNLTINANGAGPGVQKDFTVYVDNQLIGKSKFNGVFQVKIPEGQRIVKLLAPDETYEKVHEFSSSVSITF